MVANLDAAHRLLKAKKLNVTDIRCQVLLFLMEPGIALTQKELEEALALQGEAVDRVTLYRTIRVLQDKKVIHAIALDAQTVKYKLAGEHKKSNHPHFHCCHCNRLMCMPQLTIEQKMLPDGFVMQSSNLLIDGVCKACNRENRNFERSETPMPKT
jgi:Fur family transcriptional regulator, ferric uptake regulator